MNAASNSSGTNFIEDNDGGSDTDTNPHESPEYYEPISAAANNDEDSSDENSDDDHEPTFHALPNGYAHCLENGVSSLDLSSDDEEEEEEEEEEVRTREAADTAVRRAFRDDESRRNAPLTPENATRVREAMRGISFGGFPPDWAARLPEDRWINQLRRIRQPPSTTAPFQD